MKMNSTKEILETVVDTQKKAINSFMETANKFQDAFKSGNGFEKTTEIYNDWLKNQMAEFKDITTEAKEESENLFKTSKDKAEEFYKNIYQNQLDAIKKSVEFNWNTGNPFANFGCFLLNFDSIKSSIALPPALISPNFNADGLVPKTGLASRVLPEFNA